MTKDIDDDPFREATFPTRRVGVREEVWKSWGSVLHDLDYDDKDYIDDDDEVDCDYHNHDGEGLDDDHAAAAADDDDNESE